MNTATHSQSIESFQSKSKIHSSDLSNILKHYASHIKVISLDCFDTILWRKTAAPYDVFYDLQHRPSFKTLGFSPNLRISAENFARKLQIVKVGSNEVTLNNIYQAHFPHLTSEQLHALAEDELSAEMETCYAFPPIIQFMREAHALGLKIIIVSDTYLTEIQLRRLLERALPKDVFGALDKIFCSCEYGSSKCNGLFAQITDEMTCATHEILHIGDNIYADYESPKKDGINAFQLQTHDESISHLLRMESLAASIMDPSIRQIRPLSSLFRGLFAVTPAMDADEAVGFYGIGPIMYAFARFILNEVREKSRTIKQPKVLFLMRDGYLPSLLCETLAGKPFGQRVRISRFVAIAASFRTLTDIDRYLAEVVQSLRFKDICRQLLLPEDMANAIIQQTEQSSHPLVEFIKLIHQEAILATILKQSNSYRFRLKQYLIKEVDLKPGDNLLFIDLGYIGTAQKELFPIFQDELDVHIAGCYLIALRTPESSSRCGLLDATWCDDRTMLTLVNFIALLEQICTCHENSVVDYDNEGNPIYSDNAISHQQNTKLVKIQQACVRFALEAEKFFHESGIHISNALLRDAALTSLSRLLFLPTKDELCSLRSFEFDLNLGTKDLIHIFDEKLGLTGLRRRGLFFMERNLKTMRTNYPAELRSAGLELTLFLMIQNRFVLEIAREDCSLRRENIKVIILQGQHSTQMVSEAHQTHDGYFSLLIPVGNGNFQVGVIFGSHYEWVQIESAQLIKISALLTEKESENTEEVMEKLIIDQMIERGKGIFECLSTSALVFLPPAKLSVSENFVFRIVFRPLLHRISTSAK